MRSSWVAVITVAWLGLSISLPACGDNTAATPASSSSSSTGAGGSGGGGGMGGSFVACDSANIDLDTTGLTQLVYDDGAVASHVREQNFAVTTTQEYVFNEQILHEAVRFELEHPARIHGFEVMWAALPEGIAPKAELRAGLYSDFGYNGFDFWAQSPLWTGARCAEDVDDSGRSWTRYTFETPIEIDHPGLIYVAHQAAPGEAVWWFDGTQQGPDDNPCGDFDHCQSAFNMPEADGNIYYNGLSFPFQRHFMVRLWLEYTDNVQPADKLFQQVAADGPSGRHVSFVDYDQDGYDDLLTGGLLWRNNGDGTFTDVTESAGLAGISPTGGVWGDYDNDGCLDLFAFKESVSQSDHLLHNNCDGTFTDVTAASAIADQQSYEDCGDPANTDAPTAAAAWFDLEGDGFIDLYLANFFCWDQEDAYIDTVWHNNGDGTFSALSDAQGFTNQRRPSRNVTPIDHDGDGDVDLLVGNYRLEANQFFENQGDGTVVENALAAGLAGRPLEGWWGHTIGTTWGDLDNDGDFDAIAANLAHPRFYHFSDRTMVLLNEGGSYTYASNHNGIVPREGNGLRYQETHSVPELFDVDQDGVLDLAITCVYDGRPSDFYWGDGDGTFTLDAYHAGITTENGWGMAAADFDHDGDMDLFASQLFQNTLSDSAKGHWLQVHVTGAAANRAAIGATVRVTAGAVTRMRHVQGGNGKGGQDSFYLHFGLGDASQVDQIQVLFPGGNEVTFAGPFTADQRLFVKEDEAAPVSSWVYPF